MKWERDKKLHAVVGALIAFVVGALLIIFSSATVPQAAFLGLVMAAVAGWAKEYLYDVHYPDKHTVDKNDFYATTLGGVVGAILTVAADSLIQVLS